MIRDWQRYKDGRTDDGFVQLADVKSVENYISKELNLEANVEVIDMGKTYPYNRSNPYSHDTYKVVLSNGDVMQFERQYGRPVWSGNVSWTERISLT
tara:strand:- start:2044 stop:2334 length:291 start_codon:yes stop_codon:yes gene_type:complete